MNNKLILYGCGHMGKMWMEHLGSENVFAFADSDISKVGLCIKDKKILSLDELIGMRNEVAIFISTSYEYKREIFGLLKRNGLEGRIIGSPYLNQSVFADWDSQIDVLSSFEGRNALLKGVKVSKCQLGFASYISSNTILNNVKVGRYSCIGPDVRIIVGQHPTRKFVSIHPMFYSTQQTIHKSFVAENLYNEFRYTKDGYVVEIGNDVWIGNGVSIMEGITIMDGTIVASGANVVKNTEPYSIVGGNPAKVIRYRFDKREIDFLMNLRWWDKGNKWIEEHAKYFTDISKFMSVIYQENEL